MVLHRNTLNAMNSEEIHGKGVKQMSTIQFKIDFETKLGLVQDAFKNNLTISTLMRRLVSLYLTDESIREKVL